MTNGPRWRSSRCRSGDGSPGWLWHTRPSFICDEQKRNGWTDFEQAERAAVNASNLLESLLWSDAGSLGLAKPLRSGSGSPRAFRASAVRSGQALPATRWHRFRAAGSSPELVCWSAALGVIPRQAEHSLPSEFSRAFQSRSRGVSQSALVSLALSFRLRSRTRLPATRCWPQHHLQNGLRCRGRRFYPA